MMRRFLRLQTGSDANAVAMLAGEVQRQATVIAFERCFAIIGFVFFVPIPLVFLVENIKPGRGHQVEIE